MISKEQQPDPSPLQPVDEVTEDVFQGSTEGGTTPPGPTHEATTPPGNPAADEDAVLAGWEKLERAGGGHY